MTRRFQPAEPFLAIVTPRSPHRFAWVPLLNLPLPRWVNPRRRRPRRRARR